MKKIFDLLSNNSIWCAKIQCAVFKGINRDVFIDKREYALCVQNQIEEAYEFVLRNIRLSAQIKGLYRRDIYEIPVEVIRELIVNAVVHRNYLESSHIQVAIFDDRLEITSPGSLPRGITVERMKSGYSKVRNEGLANAFHYMKFIEHWGTGIPRIIKLVTDAGLKEPEFIDMDGALRINIYRTIGDKSATKVEIGDKSATKVEIGDKSATKVEIGDKSATKLNESNPQMIILNYMKSHEECSSKEIAELLGLKLSRTKDYLNALVDDGLIVAVGANKNRRYKISEYFHAN